MEEITLATVDSKGKIRIAAFQYEWSDTKNGYVITRQTGCYGGKMTEQPAKIITVGKAKRTLAEQVVLEFNSLVKKSKDKGYKELEKDLSEYTESELHEFIGDIKTNASGIVKPMLAKQEDKVTNRAIFDNGWYASRKIDGVRVLFFWDGEEIHTSSRGGEHYDYSTNHLRQHPKLIEYFKSHPTLILDGELYKHGKQLQDISGASRLEKNAYDCDWLELYIYDVVDLTLSFKDRLKILYNIKSELNLFFNPEKEWQDGELQIQMVPHEYIAGWSNIMDLHNEYVSEGFEGCVIRDPNKLYKPAGRSNSMIKIKQYKDAEFKITGYELGLRGTEDMVFNCITPNGLPFKAKPHGDRELKQWYVDNFETECLGQYAKVKYFYYSNGNDEVTGVPLQPVMLCIRKSDDM